MHDTRSSTTRGPNDFVRSRATRDAKEDDTATPAVERRTRGSERRPVRTSPCRIPRRTPAPCEHHHVISPDLDDVATLVLDDDGDAVGVRVTDARQPGEAFAKGRLVDVELVRCDLSGCDFSESVVGAGAAASTAVRRRSICRRRKLRDVTFERLPARRGQPAHGPAAAGPVRRVAAHGRGAHRRHASRRSRSGAAISPAPTSRTRSAAAVDLRAARLDGLRGVGSLSGAHDRREQLIGLAPALAVAAGLKIGSDEDE